MCTGAVKRQVRTWEQWFALLGGASAWAGHLLLAYVVAEFGCVSGWGRRTLGAASLVSWVLMGISAVMVAAAVVAVAVARGVRRRAELSNLDADGLATARYVARFGLIANGLFLFIIVVQSLPIFFYLGRC